jgi:hypothetical protein
VAAGCFIHGLPGLRCGLRLTQAVKADRFGEPLGLAIYYFNGVSQGLRNATAALLDPGSRLTRRTG